MIPVNRATKVSAPAWKIAMKFSAQWARVPQNALGSGGGAGSSAARRSSMQSSWLDAVLSVQGLGAARRDGDEPGACRVRPVREPVGRGRHAGSRISPRMVRAARIYRLPGMVEVGDLVKCDGVEAAVVYGIRRRWEPAGGWGERTWPGWCRSS